MLDDHAASPDRKEHGKPRLQKPVIKRAVIDGVEGILIDVKGLPANLYSDTEAFDLIYQGEENIKHLMSIEECDE